MMIKKTNSFFLPFIQFTLILSLVSCKQDLSKVVTAVTSRILEPVSFEIDRDPNMGEIIVGDDPVVITMKVRNNSSDKIQKMQLLIDQNQSLLKFKENKNGDVYSPGDGGNCQSTLSPGAQCTYVVSFNPRKTGVFEIPVSLKYENLIEPQEKTVVFRALTGEPASLVFTNDKSTYDLGVLEQTDTTERFLDLELINSGGLSARSVQPNFANANPIGAFKLVSHNCPVTIKAQEKCQVKISYSPKNNAYADPLVEYKSQLSITYITDPKGTQSNLNSYAEFISTTIEAKFKENFKMLDFGVVFAGNKLKKTVKITNIGYNSGILQELIFTDYKNDPITTCTKSSGPILDCNKPLDQFPFVIEDANECFGTQVKGIEGKIQGASCIVNITYWPSKTWPSGSQALHYFNDMDIALKYDSLWKGLPNILVRSEMFNILADFLSAGKMEFLSMMVENSLVGASKITNAGSTTTVDMGRIALVSSDAFSKFIKISWKNVGENSVSIDKITDKNNPVANLITEAGYDINAFYKHIKTSTGCDFVSPGATCNITFDLAPVLQASSAIEDQLMYDDISNLAKKIKTFSIQYNNGAAFEDNGDPVLKSFHHVNLTSKLIKKGVLAFSSPLTNSTALVNGKSDVKNLCLTNVGTGEIYAIKSHSTENLYPNGTNSWPFKIQDLSTVASSCASPATKDCYDIIFKNSDTLPVVADSAKFLAAGQTCVLSFEVKLSETIRDEYYILSEEQNRPFGPAISSTADAWPRKKANIGPLNVSFSFYDGDYVSTDPASYPNYGYTDVTKKTAVTASFYKPAQLVLVNPTPVSSAVLHRPKILYPLLSSTYPVTFNLAAKTIPEIYFSNTYFTGLSNGFTKSDESYLHVDTLNLKGGIYDTEFKMHIGTFTVGDTVTASLDVKNTGDMTALNVTFSETAAASPISIEGFGGTVVKPFAVTSILSNLTKTVTIKFAPAAPGLFKKCFDLSYNNQLLVTDQHVCIYAEAVAAAPKIKVQYNNIDVAMPGPTETPNGSYINLNAPINSSDGTALAFSAIKDSAIYDKKIVRFTNIGTVAAKRFNYYYMLSATSAAGGPPADTILTGTPVKGCINNATINAGDYCEIYIKYQPTKTSLASALRFLGMIYEVAPNSSQYVTQVSGINFNSLDPAKLSIASTSPESLNDWSNPAMPLPVSESWPLDLTAYNKTTNTHLTLSSLPQTKTFSTITVRNTTSLKASFLYMNPAPAAGVWNLIYSNSFITVNANRACFYGDDEFSAVPANQKGFNNITVAPCQLSVEFKGHETYTACSAWNAPVKTKTVRIGDLVDTACNPYVFKLGYYNNNRASYESMYFHIKGFIEPNKSATIVPPVFENVSSTYVSGIVGRVNFSWPAITPITAGWGNVTKYRIYYDLSAAILNGANIFKLTGGPAFVETANASILNVTINNLTAGKYYYFKVMAVRTYSGINYLSNTNLPLLTLPIPAADHVYHHASRTLIDKAYLSVPGNRAVGVTTCAAKFFNVVINGATIKHNKTLITTPVWTYLNSAPGLSTGYPGEGIGSIPHWLGDDLYDLKTNISLYDGSILPGYPDYSATSMNGNNSAYKVIYQKSCNNNVSCDRLHKIVGGDDVDLYYMGVYYAKDTAATAYYRCNAVIKCPTSTTKLITDPTCAAP